MRSLALATFVLLGACGRGEPQPQAVPGARPIACALAGATAFTRDCLVEKVAGEQGTEFVIRHPDGGVRRLRIAQDRSGMVAIDGADEARNALVGDPPVLEVSVAADRYRFPADLDAGR